VGFPYLAMVGPTLERPRSLASGGAPCLSSQWLGGRGRPMGIGDEENVGGGL